MAPLNERTNNGRSFPLFPALIAEGRESKYGSKDVDLHFDPEMGVSVRPSIDQSIQHRHGWGSNEMALVLPSLLLPLLPRQCWQPALLGTCLGEATKSTSNLNAIAVPPLPTQVVHRTYPPLIVNAHFFPSSARHTRLTYRQCCCVNKCASNSTISTGKPSCVYVCLSA